MKLILPYIAFAMSIISQAQELKTPSEFLGYDLGTRFTPHHQVVAYFNYISEAAAERVQFHEYGRTNEHRPLVVAYVSSAQNMGRLEDIRKEHLNSTQGGSPGSKAIVWLGYNVHGNESVSTEASMQTIYELLTTKQSYLENTVVIIDPCINPDGRDRYVNWYNQFKNTPGNVDPNSKEHHEGWWNGRSNHYMFDLNRDWAWLTQTESRQRLKEFNKWLPHVHVDFHEQGVENPYYFAPAAEPFHEVITDFQRDFQVLIGKNHAKYFDAKGWFYFTKEVFDLFYPSYGDTYPTYNGAIGMTYEQGGGGVAGLGILMSGGDTLTLKDRIAHHLTTGLSTVEVASVNVEKLNTEFSKFYSDRSFTYKSYVMSGNRDHLDALARLLDQHEISYSKVRPGTQKGFDYKSGKTGSLKTGSHSMIVSTEQPRGTLVKVLFEPNARLSDSLTYDITAWSLPFAYGLDAIASESVIKGDPYEKAEARDMEPEGNPYAYLTDWNSMDDARFLADLLSHKVRVRSARRPFRMEGQLYDRGSLIITNADNMHLSDFKNILAKAAAANRQEIRATSTGFVEGGKDFGSGYVELVPKVMVGVLAGGPTSTLRFGEIWHFFEQQLHYPVSILDAEYMEGLDLTKYQVLILPDGGGYTSFMTEALRGKLKDWVNHGGRLIAMGGAIKSIAGEDGFGIRVRESIKDTVVTEVKSYELTQREQISNEITGAIFSTKVDPTHPLAFGYGDTYYSLKLGGENYEYLSEGTVAYLEDAPLPVAGFAGNSALKNMGRTLVFGAESVGEGQVVYLADNPLFRGFWENGKLFFANALFQVH